MKKKLMKVFRPELAQECSDKIDRGRKLVRQLLITIKVSAKAPTPLI
jgi:hypothetical protein